MEPRISMITLGVSDRGRSVSFYKDVLGLPLSKHSVENAVAFFELDGAWLGLFGRTELAKDAQIQNDAIGFDGITLSHNLKSEEEVKRFFEALEGRGVEIVKQPQRADWGGYSGYFQDPDGHCGRWHTILTFGLDRSAGEGKPPARINGSLQQFR
jgi:catechol 2,3-dioxygenase-like lactoylglutathione lyase family enzyme